MPAHRLHLVLITTLLALPLLAPAGTPPKEFERFKPASCRPQAPYSAEWLDAVVAETPTHVLVRQDAGINCAAGNFLLFNKKARTFKPVDSGTCDDRGFSVHLTGDRLSFTLGKRVTGLYPVYTLD